MRYLEYCDPEFPNLEDTRPKLPFTLIFSYKISTHVKKMEEAVNQEQKVKKKQEKKRMKDRN